MVLFHSRFHFVVYSSRSCISPSSKCSYLFASHEFIVRCALPNTYAIRRSEVEKKYNLITRRLREVLGVIKDILAREGRSPKAY
ncbi:hypothetical protein EV363DRAFT_1171527 [Boletus edulis]|nr:hypothetical protein EV363DRAFT_1171527 [Boletus edulis]